MSAATPKLAFALGGLAGNNAHGAGFLQAALDEGVRPAMISCTSGQIRWVYEYLRDPNERKETLRQLQEQAIVRMDPLKFKALDFWYLSAFGYPNVFRPALLDWPLEFFKNFAAMVHRVFRSRFDVIPFVEFLRTLPCRLLVPVPDREFFNKASQTFNASPIGIVFNSFNPSDGIENVYLNDAARAYLRKGQEDKHREATYQAGEPSSYRERTLYQKITPDAVRDALWLYNYGFDPEDRPESHELFLDGAYFRDIILNELTPARRIYVARPVNYRWTGALPTNYADLEDLKTKLSFNGTYDGERHQILLINKLLKKKNRRLTLDGSRNKEPDSSSSPTAGNGPVAIADEAVEDAGGYHLIELIEVEIQRPRGFIDYMFEDMGVFDDAYRQACKAFRRHEGDGDGHGPPSKPALRSSLQPIS